MNRDAPLAAFRLQPGVSMAQAGPKPGVAVTLDSPALDVMTDLTKVKAATIGPEQTLPQAEQAMVYLGVRMLFVVSHMPDLEGLITSTDLRGERQMRLVHQRGAHYDELRVADVMTPLAEIDALEFSMLRSATVSNLVATLQHQGRNHLLVVERDGGSRRVRGVVSRAQIARQLGVPVDVIDIAHSFSEIERALV